MGVSRWANLMLTVGIIAALVIGPASSGAVAYAATGSQPLKAHPVDTLWTSEFGVDHPVGVGYDAALDQLLVFGDDASAPRVLRFDSNRDLAGVEIDRSGELLRSLDVVDGGQEVDLNAYLEADRLTYVLAPDLATLGAVDGAGRSIRTYDLSAVDLSEPVAMIFAPTTDKTDDPAATNLFMADAGGDTLGGIVEVSLAQVQALAAPVDNGSLVAVTATSSWNPASPDPSGVVWMPGSSELLVVDSEVDESTGAGWHDVNMWRTDLDGSVIGVGTFWGSQAANGGFSREPTGVGYDAVTDTLFVSDDDARRIYILKRGSDGEFGTSDDNVTSLDTGAYGSGDAEDPEYVDGILYFLDGTSEEIYRIDPVDDVFGNGNDQMTHFDIGYLGPSDFEGLTSDPDRGTLYVGARTTKEIFEVTTSGSLVRTIDVGSIGQMSYISGLTVAPASDGSGQLHFYSVDRKVDNDEVRSENDGRMFEIAAPGIGGGGPVNNPPVAVDDSATVVEDSSVTIEVLANDSDPDGDSLSVGSLGTASSGSVVDNGDGTVTYTPDADFWGSDSFTYRAFDGSVLSNVANVDVTVSAVNDPPVAFDDADVTGAGEPVTIDVVANDPDADGDSLLVGSLGTASSGLAVNNGDGTVTYTPNSGFTGSDSFTYRAFDGTVLSNIANVDVTVSPVNPPQTTIVSGPPAESGSDATFSFSSDKPGSTFECSLDGAPFSSCSSPKSYASLSVSSHHFEVTATDTSGNTDPTPATWDWSVSSSLTYEAFADTYVDAAAPGSSFGSATSLSSDAGSQPEEALLRFNVTGVGAPVTSALIRVYVTNATGNGPEVFPVVGSWVESTVTWNNKPVASGGAIFDAGPIGSGAWYEFDVSSYVTGNGQYDFGLVPQSTDGLNFRSREFTGYAPELHVTTESAPDLTPPTVVSTLPVNGATNVPIGSLPNAVFSEAMAMATVNSSSFTLSDGVGLVPASVSYDVPSLRATLTPDSPLGLGTTYTAMIDTSVTDLAGNPLASAHVWTFSTPDSDVTPPETTITSGPPASTSETTASFTFTANEPATFECSLDGAAFTACSSPQGYSSLAPGPHSFGVQATDLAGNPDATPTIWDWLVMSSNVFLPTADAYVDERNASFNYGSSTVLRSDGGNGNHEEALLRFDVGGLVTPVESATLRVYATNGTSSGPEVFPAQNGWNEGSVTWNSKPARTGGAAFDADAIAANGWYEFDVTPMITGNGTFTINLASVSTDAVRFYSREGANPPELVVEVDSTPDATPPTVTATVPSSGAVDVSVGAAVTVTFSEPMDPTSIDGASFTLSGGGGVAGVVSYDGPSMTATFSPSGPLGFDTIHTATLTTAVTDAAGNPLAAPYVWSFTAEATDTDPPETVIESGPPAETGDDVAAFGFTADETGSTFQCSLDGSAFTSCSSPASYVGVAVGAHHFEVRATDQAANTDPTPASWDWTVTASSTFLAVADTQVNASRTTTNFGDDVTIISDGGPKVVEALLRFDVSGVGGLVGSAVLRIYVTNGSYNGPEVFPAQNGWDELSVNWNTKPARTGGAVADAGSIGAGDWYEFDVTALVAGNATYTFNLESVSSDAIKFSSREVAGFEPQLVVTSG